MADRNCLRCGKPISGHLNRKRCEPCARALRRSPRGTMTEAQKARALRMIGKISREEIAQKIGVSVANLKRSMRGQSFWFYNGKWKNNPEFVAKVLNHYWKHGMPATKKKFNGISVKSIVDRPEYYGHRRVYRQRRWTETQKIELVRMSGLVSHGSQARYFDRPKAAGGSIKSAWVKVFGVAPGRINGMSFDIAKHIAKRSTPYVRPNGWSSGVDSHQWTVLWVDLEDNLMEGVPEYIKEAVKTMADFQRWIWGCKNPKAKIMKMIDIREVANE